MSELDNALDSLVGGEEIKPQEKAQQTKAKRTEKAQASDHIELIKKLSEKISALEKRLEEKEKQEAGNPANEWAKQLAKEKANRKAKPFKTIYSVKDGKVVKIDVKTNGAYQSYIGNAKKQKNQIVPLITQWKKEGVWVEEYDLETTIKEIMLELNIQGE